MKTIIDYLQERLYQDLCYNCCQVNETGGLYDGQIELATYIMNDIEKNKDKQKFKLTYNSSELKFNNIFFNTLTVNVNFVHVNFVKAYSSFFNNLEENDLYERYNYDKNTNKLNNVTITINCNNDLIKFYNDIRGRISHELTHAYTYFEIIKDDFKEPNIVPEEYHNKLHKWTNKIYDKISNNIENPLLDEAKRIAYFLIYTLTRYERNAFLSEILSFLFDKESSFSTAEQIQNKLNSSYQYMLYTYEGPEIIEIIKNKWSKNQKQQLKEVYNDIYNTNKSCDKIIKLLDIKIQETIKKINHNVNKLSKKYINRTIIKENTFFDPSYEEISFLHYPYIIEWF